MSNVSQRFVTRFGPRRVLAAGLLFMAASEGYLVRLPVHGHYVADLLPSFILVGLGMGVSFVAVTIAALAGVPGRDAGIASGLVNTSRQIGGAIGLAAITTIASSAAGGHTLAATTHGYRVAFGTLTVLALVGAVLTTTMRVAQREEHVTAETPVDAGLAMIEEAA
jgi:MFS family permease